MSTRDYGLDTREESLQFEVKISPGGDTIIVEFGKPVAWMAMPKDEAVKLAFTILKGVGAKIERNIDLKFPFPDYSDFGSAGPVKVKIS